MGSDPQSHLEYQYRRERILTEGLTAIAKDTVADGMSRAAATDALARAGIPLICPTCQLPIQVRQGSLGGIHQSCLPKSKA